MLPYLVHVEAIVSREILLTSFPYHPKHYPNESCAFHVGYIGNSTKDFLVFTNKVQELIDQKILSFFEEQPNVKTNHLYVHNGLTVNVIEEEEYTEVVREVPKVKTPMIIVLKKLQEHGFLEGLHDGFTICETESDECVRLKSCVQYLINQRVIQFTKVKAAE